MDTQTSTADKMNGSSPTNTQTTTTDTVNQSGEVPLVCESFNCHGFKHSADYICEELDKCDIMCLSETWLKPHEQNVIKDAIITRTNTRPEDWNVFTKSGMTEIDINSYTGRPYGGVAMICKNNGNFSFQEVEVSCDRILPVGVYDLGGNLSQVIVCVYMPYYKQGDPVQTEALISTIDALQTVLDKFAMSAPITFCGDFNVKLPQGDKLHKTWYKKPGFNVHSSLLYDFIVVNKLHVANFMFKQTTAYTYFCHKRHVYTYIDHVLVSKPGVDLIRNCTIIPEDSGNLSDHLPLRTSMMIPVSAKPIGMVVSDIGSQPISTQSWDDPAKHIQYRDILASKIQNLKPLDLPDDANRQSSQFMVDQYLANLTNAIHEAAQEADCTSRRTFKPKAYWCPELSTLRDKKRFWWKLWVENGRPQSGAVSDCYRGIKRLYRKTSRRYINYTTSNNHRKLDQFFKARKMTAFWNALKRTRKHPVKSNLSPDQFADYYARNMNDTDNLSKEQQGISDAVISQFEDNISLPILEQITASTMSLLIDKLNKRSSPGIDGITAKHLFYGKSSSLCECLASLYSLILTHHIVPEIFTKGVIIPIPKKSGLDPNDPSSYRPITIGSTFSKLMEIYLTPKDIPISDNQFGFQEGKSTTMACSLINDILAYCVHHKSPVYVATLDAEKCFDKIWHDGLHFKLMKHLPLNTWLFIVEWYKHLTASVRWHNVFSQSFQITRGMRQGSALSPLFFNIFINDLLQELETHGQGVRIGNHSFKSVAYADDISLFSLTTPGLQDLINRCVQYAKMWQFSFSMKKSKCMCVGPTYLTPEPKWYIGSHCLENTDCLDILGIKFDRSLDGNAHIKSRSTKCRQSFYAQTQMGMNYPGLHSNVKKYIWNCICLPTLTYGLESISVSNKGVQQLDSLQGCLLKQSIGLSKQSQHTYLCKALGIPSIHETLSQKTIMLWYNIFRKRSPARDLCCHFLKKYVGSGLLVPGTLLYRVLQAGYSPTKCAYWPAKYKGVCNNNGIVDTIQSLVLHENFNKPKSDEYFMLKLLTKSF
jgi:exonuclease III